MESSELVWPGVANIEHPTVVSIYPPITTANMFSFSLCSVALALVPLSYSLFSQDQTPLHEVDHSPFTSDFDKFVIRLMNDWHVPGLAIAIVNGNETYSKVCVE